MAGAGPAVVAIHGGPADLRMRESLVPALAESYRMIRYDLRGLGRSEPPTAPYRMAGDVAAVHDHLGEASTALVGFSTGGAIAAEFTVQRDPPKRLIRAQRGGDCPAQAAAHTRQATRERRADRAT